MSGPDRYRSDTLYSLHGCRPVLRRWIECPRRSLTTISDKFVAFKAPLYRLYDGLIPVMNRFNTNMVFSSMSNTKVTIGLWIDLTQTSRFYKKSEIEKKDCAYVNIPCTGRDQIPTREEAKLFVDICSKFVAEHPLQCIGVHCTYGFNRTGFMIATYLIEKLGIDVTSAIALFATARPPGIYKQVYIVELFQRYSDETPIAAPALPHWCYEPKDKKRKSKQRKSSSKRKRKVRKLKSNNEKKN